MTRWAWLALSILSALNLPAALADENQDSRQFNFNPGNMADGIMNPMRSMFGGSGHDRGYYDDYYGAPPYYGPPGYPGDYGYPGNSYAQPYPGYSAGYPGYYAQPAAPQSQPVPQQQPAVRQAPVRETSPGYYDPQVTTPPAYWQQPSQDAYSFRPMENQPENSGGYPEAAPVYQQPGTYPAAPDSYASPQPGYGYGYESPPQGGYGSGYETPPQGGYESAPGYPQPSAPGGVYAEPYTSAPASAYPEQSYSGYNGTQEPGLKFRPLDQPGYSQ
ncbi:MAG: hypothetical protein ABW076_08820 [Candidatus Thiodiazotropha sp.]